MAEGSPRKRKTAAGRKRKAAPARQLRKTTAGSSRKAKAPKKPPQVADGMLLVSVYGAFSSRALVDMSVERATELFGSPLSSWLASSRVVDAVEKELETLAKRNPEIASSAVAASAVALAYEIQNPYNSATSKSMCARELRETMAKLRELAPEAEGKDDLDELSARRASRRRRATS
jgi:hypothetical protein